MKQTPQGHTAREHPSQDLSPRLPDAKVQLLTYKCGLPRNHLASSWAPVFFFGQTQPTVASPDPLGRACIPQSPRASCGPGPDIHGAGPQIRVLPSEGRAGGTSFSPTLLPPLRGTQIAILDQQPGVRKKHTERSSVFLPCPSVHCSAPKQGWGSRTDFPSS